MSVIYEPRGKAGEYSPLAANLYKGCAHGCLYCYAPAATFTAREVFVGRPAPRKNVLDQLERDAESMAGDPRQILLSFTSDPYQPIETEEKLTRRALAILHKYDLRATVLTKGGMLACRDFDILSWGAHNEFAVTLTTDDPDESLAWEPGAAPPGERLESLRRAHAMGIRTWVSFEPVINPDAVYRLLEASLDYVDLYKVGKLNYHKLAGTIDWRGFREKITELLERAGKPYIIKKDLAAC